MRILMTIHTALDPDAGAPGATMRLACEYRQQGHEVDVLGFDSLLPDWLPEQAKMVGFPWSLAVRLARMTQGSSFDVIDASTGDAWLLGVLRRAFPPGVRCSLLVARSHGLEHRIAEHTRHEAASGGEPISWKYPLYHGGYRLWEVKNSLRSADVALFLNCADAETAITIFGVQPERAEVVRNGISNSLIGRSIPSPSSGARRIAVIGSYIPRKGTVHIAAALNIWLRRHPDWAVTFLGTGVAKSRILADYDPVLHGQISTIERYANDDLPVLLLGHHVHLFPTLAEGAPLSLLEAMACGLVPVASAVPGVIETLRHGENSLLVPPGEPEPIVAALDQLANDPTLLDRLRVNAHSAAQSFSWSTVAAEQMTIYEAHLDRHLRGRAG
jgi:glycosyltransferase involved in cell wall biosynthesis